MCCHSQDLFTTLNDLIDYLDLNREGFRKVIKKHDKVGWGVLGVCVHRPGERERGCGAGLGRGPTVCPEVNKLWNGVCGV